MPFYNAAEMQNSPADMERLLDVLVHIQNHLDEELSLQRLARVAHLSPHHFHRVFRKTIGETLKAYTQRLRLEKAACQLGLRQATVLEIALDSGFKNHETFTRAFKRHFGEPPRAFKAKLESVAESCPDDERRSLNRLRHGYEISAVSLHRLKPVHLAFIRNLGPYAQVDTGLFDRLVDWSRQNQSYRTDALLVGIGHDAPGLTPPERLRFDACIEVPKPFRPQGNIGYQTLPQGLFALTSYVGPLGKVMEEAYVEIVAQVRALKGHQLVGLPVVEIYRTTRINPQYHLDQTDIYIPVKEG